MLAPMKTLKPDRHAKAERRANRKDKGHRQRAGSSMQVLGGTMDPDLMDDILAAAQRLDPMGAWADIAPTILPVIKRLHHPYPPEAAAIYLNVPPGVWTGFGIDFGPAFSHVTAQLVERWGVDQATLLGASLDNLRRLVVDEPPIVQRFSHHDVKLVGISGQGWGSSLLLLPEILRQHLGDEPKVLLTPIRNTLIALPDDVDGDLALDIWHALADGAHDELDVDPMCWTGSAVVAIGDGSRGLPN